MKKLFFILTVNLCLIHFVSAQNVGIGTSSPAYKLDVSGNAHTTGTLTVDSNVNVTGDVTAHGGGVLYNTVSPATTNLKVYYRTASFSVTGLAPHTVSAEGAVDIGGGFTAAPMVFVGDMINPVTSEGPLYQLQLIVYGSTASGFKIRILNNSNYTISQSCGWNVMCIGQ
jgi:hypothetical protein